jgi:hypothetical protein
VFLTDTFCVTSGIQLPTVIIYTTKSYTIAKKKNTKFLLTQTRNKYTVFNPTNYTISHIQEELNCPYSKVSVTRSSSVKYQSNFALSAESFSILHVWRLQTRRSERACKRQPALSSAVLRPGFRSII